MKYDVTVIGAGVVGALIARTLSRYELSVCLADKESDVSMGASKANSGIVHAGYAVRPGTLKAKLNVDGSNMMDRVTSELGVPFRHTGSFVVGFGGGDMPALRRLMEDGEANGVKSLRIIDGGEAHAMEPNLSDEITCALYAPTAGIISPYELTIAAAENAVSNGVELRLSSPVTAIAKNSDGFTVTAGGREFDTRYIVNAAGVYSDVISAMAGDPRLSVKPRRGEYMLLDKSQGGMVGRIIFQPPTKFGKGILVTPTADGNLLIGPTASEQDDRDDVSTTAEGLAAVGAKALRSVPGLRLREVITSFAGLRAVPAGGDFIIGQSELSPRLINAAGIESPGLSASPAIAEYVADILSRAGLKLTERGDYDPIRRPEARFSEMTDEQKAEKIRENPLYGRIICRCEGVTEGEIVDAIHRPVPATDLDAIKRRTRQGMGRCQGGFCIPRVIGILSRELGIPEDKITKSGAGSEMLSGPSRS
jgi:glycerol-3-phosphate dehydrogenase